MAGSNEVQRVGYYLVPRSTFDSLLDRLSDEELDSLRGLYTLVVGPALRVEEARECYDRACAREPKGCMVPPLWYFFNRLAHMNWNDPLKVLHETLGAYTEQIFTEYRLSRSQQTAQSENESQNIQKEN